jgi:hypothetical protein
MYWTTPSGTRYQTDRPSAARSRMSVEEIAIAGMLTRLNRSESTWLRSCLAGVGEVVAGAGHTDAVREVEHVLPVPPGDDAFQRVRTGDEVQLRVRVPAAGCP